MLWSVVLSLSLGCGDNLNDEEHPDAGAAVVEQLAYIKASNGAGFFGDAIDLDGDTLVVGATGDDSAAVGVNGDQLDSSASGAGAAFVLERTAAGWSHRAYIKASNTEVIDFFGWDVAIDGDTLAVSAVLEDSAETGANGDEDNNDATDSGAVYIFVRDGDSWRQQAYIKASNTEKEDYFGFTIALHGDTLAVSAQQEDSAATGVNGNQNDNSAPQAGAVYVFVREGTTWTQQAYLKAPDTEDTDFFGHALALHGDTLAIGAPSDLNGGSVFVFNRDGARWSQSSQLHSPDIQDIEFFGFSVALDDETLVAGAPFRGARIRGKQGDERVSGTGAVYVFSRTGRDWIQEAILEARTFDEYDHFGHSVAVDGSRLVVGAVGEDGSATGVNGDESDNGAEEAGSAYVFSKVGRPWLQTEYLKASNTETMDAFGLAVAASGDVVVVSAPREDSKATGVNGDPADNSAPNSGALYLFE